MQCAALGMEGLEPVVIAHPLSTLNDGEIAQRAKEALRVLEECTRLIAPRRTASFQRLRFRTYEVERDLLRGLATLRHR